MSASEQNKPPINMPIKSSDEDVLRRTEATHDIAKNTGNFVIH